jgi:hypothetical protein
METLQIGFVMNFGQCSSQSSDENIAEPAHWSECGRATSLANWSSVGRPHRSVALGGHRTIAIMATIEIENKRFAVDFEGLGPGGKSAHFRSFYTASGKPVAIRQPDRRSIHERYGRRYPDYPRSRARQGIYDSRSLAGYLVFVDKLESETQVFINWRSAAALSYRRIALGRPAFHEYGRKPTPNISDLVFVGGRFFIAWMTATQREADLVLSSIDPRKGTRRDIAVARLVVLVTLVSLAHIGTHGLIVCHRAMIGGEDAKIDVFPVRLQNPA